MTPNPSLHPGPATAGGVSPVRASGSIVTYQAYTARLRGPGELERYASPNAIHARSKSLFVAASAHEMQVAVSGAIHLGFMRRFTEPFGGRGGSEDRITHRRY